MELPEEQKVGGMEGIELLRTQFGFNSHGRNVNVYFAVHPTLVSAFLHVVVDCKLQLTERPSGRQLAVD